MADVRIENSAKAIIIENDAILLIRYRDSSEMGLGDWYSLPGGRQRFGETVVEALVRECREEIGAKVRPQRLLFVREYIHARHELATKGRDQHKVEFMFQCSIEPRTGKASDPDPDQASAEWVKLEQVPGINVFPTALRHVGELIAGSAETYWGDVY
jgi:ADP-ribose pyrophosphatase YjhB (NUDIX family)